MKLVIIGTLIAVIGLQATMAEISVSLRTDRPEALYKVGEDATFLIEVAEDGKPLAEGNVSAVFSQDGLHPQEAQTIAVKDGKANVTGRLEEPGFLSLAVQSGTAKATAAAGYEPEKIKPSADVPEDFDAFWQKNKEELAKVPMNPKLTLQPSSNEKIEVFDVKLDCVGNPVSGYFARPKGKKSLPAILTLHGAGVSKPSPNGAQQWAGSEGGMLAMDINAHGISNEHPKEYYQELAQGELKNYQLKGRQNREDSYFKGMFLRVQRAIDFLTSQPEWDGRTLILFGTSQGAFQTLAGGYLDGRVSLICAGVPAGCDHTGSLVDRISGWPKWAFVQNPQTVDPAALEASRYYDSVNFARLTKADEAVVTVGLIDTICPPTSVYAAYNALAIPKTLHVDPLANHTNTPEAMSFLKGAVTRHVKAKQSSSTANHNK